MPFPDRASRAPRRSSASHSRRATPASVTTREAVVDGVRVIEVRVVAPVPVIGLLGPDDRLDVVGRAFVESQ